MGELHTSFSFSCERFFFKKNFVPILNCRLKEDSVRHISKLSLLPSTNNALGQVSSDNFSDFGEENKTFKRMDKKSDILTGKHT